MLNLKLFSLGLVGIALSACQQNAGEQKGSAPVGQVQSQQRPVQQGTSGAFVAGGIAMHREAAGNKLTWLPDVEEMTSFARTHAYFDYGSQRYATLASWTGGLLAFGRYGAPMGAALEDLILHRIQGQSEETVDVAIMVSRHISYNSVTKSLIYLGLKGGVARLNGRKVRLALMTFGQRGKERVESFFTADLGHIQEELDRLAADSSNHSDVLGDGYLTAIDVALDKLTWQSPKRMFIAVACEDISELSTNLNGVAEIRDRVRTRLTNQSIKITTDALIYNVGQP